MLATYTLKNYQTNSDENFRYSFLKQSAEKTLKVIITSGNIPTMEKNSPSQAAAHLNCLISSQIEVRQRRFARSLR